VWGVYEHLVVEQQEDDAVRVEDLDHGEMVGPHHLPRKYRKFPEVSEVSGTLRKLSSAI
jgi:hypothetical protein